MTNAIVAKQSLTVSNVSFLPLTIDRARPSLASRWHGRWLTMCATISIYDLRVDPKSHNAFGWLSAYVYDQMIWICSSTSYYEGRWHNRYCWLVLQHLTEVLRVYYRWRVMRTMNAMYYCIGHSITIYWPKHGSRMGKLSDFSLNPIGMKSYRNWIIATRRWAYT